MKQLAVALLTAAAVSSVAGSVALASHASSAAFPAPQNGRIVFNDQRNALVLANADGSGVVRLASTNATDVVVGASWSPNGKLIAYSKYGASDPDIYVIAPDATGQREITFSRGVDIDPTWSGDGSRIAFETNRNGNSDIYSVGADGSASSSSRARRRTSATLPGRRTATGSRSRSSRPTDRRASSG